MGTLYCTISLNIISVVNNSPRVLFNRKCCSYSSEFFCQHIWCLIVLDKTVKHCFCFLLLSRTNVFFILISKTLYFSNDDNPKLKMETHQSVKSNQNFCDWHIHSKKVNFNFTKEYFSHKTNWLSKSSQLWKAWGSVTQSQCCNHVISRGIRGVRARNFVRNQVACSVCVLWGELRETISSVVLTDAGSLATS